MRGIITLIIFLLAIPIFIFSQENFNTVEFKYDDAGNRILRHAIYIPPIPKNINRKNDSIKNITKAILADSIVINNVSVSIYPNPTLGKFKVKIDNVNDEDEIQYSIFSLTGQSIDKGRVINNITEVDLQNYDNGPYLFRLVINGESKSWRIIKR